ncbi:MAG: hypothetical protein ABWX74_20905 [Aeromicrobium sp.]
MDTSRALVYYRTNYLLGVARPGALSFDGTDLALHANDLSLVWSAPVSTVKVKKGMGILTLSIDGAKTSILTAVGGTPSPSPSPELKALLESGPGIANAPSVDSAALASSASAAGIGVYATGQKSLRDYFTALGVMV